MITTFESTTIRYEFYVEQNLAKPKQAAALRSLVTFKFDSAFICDVSARANLSSWHHRDPSGSSSQECPLSESVFRLYSSFPRDVVWAEPVQDAEDLSHRDPAQHNPVLPEAVSQVGDKYLQPSSYFILFSVSEASADSPPTWSSSSPRPEGSTTTSRWSLTPSSSFLTFTILALTIDPPFELSAVFASSNVAGPGAF